MLGARRGLPWWGAVLLALVTAIAGAVLSTQVTDGLGLPFQLIYVAGALAAVAAVRRRNLFGPMVQPPLVMAVAVPLVVLTGSSLPESNDMLADVLAISTPLINNFPVMAIATGLTVALGVFRIYRERDPDRPVRDTSKRTRSRDEDGAGDRPAPPKEKRPAKSPKDKTPGVPAADADAGAAAVRRPAGDSGTSGRQRKPRPPEDLPDGPAGRGKPARGEPGHGEPGPGEPQRRGRPADGPPGRAPRGPEDAPPPRRPRPVDQDRGSRTPPPADRRPPRTPRTPPPDAGPGPKRPQRPPRGERPDPPQRPKRPRGAEPPPGRDQQRRRPWDAED